MSDEERNTYRTDYYLALDKIQELEARIVKLREGMEKIKNTTCFVPDSHCFEMQIIANQALAQDDEDAKIYKPEWVRDGKNRRTKS